MDNYNRYLISLHNEDCAYIEYIALQDGINKASYMADRGHCNDS